MDEQDLVRVLNVISASWSHGTRETYGSGLLVYHVFCDLRGVPDSERCPAHSNLILSFLAACAGSYSGTALANNVYGVQAWHTLHGAPWNITPTEVQAALDGAKRLAPPESKRSKREPFTVDLMTRLCARLDPEDPLDAAIGACFKCAFFSTACLGEFVLGNLKSFDPAIHIKRSDVRTGQDRQGNEVTILFVPRTKVSSEGEELYFARQEGPCDPEEALERHLRVNKLDDRTHLFAYHHGKSQRPLTRTTFTRRLNAIADQLGLEILRFHGIRIGSVLEYLLRGVPLAVVKVMGRWSSDAFEVYLRKHAVVLAPYLQDTPVFEEFTRLTVALPRVR